jgi:hypothetical protein
VDEAARIGGYRILRRIARGSRTIILLAHGGEPPDTVVLKVAAADDAAAVREAAALDRGAGEHVVPLLDASADDERLVLVLPRLPGADLARLLTERAELEGGEAVTVLAPIAATIGRLHSEGVAHGALTASSVRFDAEGAPVLTGFGGAVVFEAGLPEVALDRIDEVRADRAALRDLASAVLGRVGGARRAAALRLQQELMAASDANLVEHLVRGIFDVAAALPIRAADAPPAGAVAGRLVPLGVPVDASEGASRPHGAARWAATVERWIDRSPAAEARQWIVRRWATLSRGRRRLVLGAGAGALALATALVAIPGVPTPVTAAGAPGASHPASRSSSSPGSSSSGAARHGTRGGSDSGGGHDAPALRGDDPVAAAAALLTARAACRRELSVLCLDGIDQDGSAAADADRLALRAAQSGGELAEDPLPPAPDASPRLIERVGDSALIGVANGASLLLVREDGAWRIRDLLPAPTPAADASAPSPAG